MGPLCPVADDSRLATPKSSLRLAGPLAFEPAPSDPPAPPSSPPLPGGVVLANGLFLDWPLPPLSLSGAY